jgi:hypothetical protein
VGLSTDPSTADSCSDLAGVAINQLQDFVDRAVGEQSYDEFLAAYAADNGEAFTAASAAYAESSLATDIRRAELGCGDEFQHMLCDGLQSLETGGSAADEILAPSRAACG